MQLKRDISIITVNYNGLRDTCELLDSLPSDDASLEVIVVDNASAGNEADIIAERYPAVTVIKSERNLGFAEGNNLGIRQAHGRYLLLINNDTVMLGSDAEKTESLRALARRLETSPTIGAVSPKIRFLADGQPIQFAGYTRLSPLTLRNRAVGFGQSDRGQYDAPRPTPYCHGAAMMVSREAVDRAGLMPDSYFLYYEEIDWSLMLRRAGYAIWYDPVCTVYHKESRSTGQHSPTRAYYLTRNRFILARRNIAVPQRWLTYLWLAVVAAPKDILASIAKGRFRQAQAVVRGVFDFIRGKEQQQ